MADDRSKREKLEAMASQNVSPNEADVARHLLDRLPAPRTLSRDEILAHPDTRVPSRPRRFYDPNLRVTMILDDDDPIFEWAANERSDD